MENLIKTTFIEKLNKITDLGKIASEKAKEADEALKQAQDLKKENPSVPLKDVKSYITSYRQNFVMYHQLLTAIQGELARASDLYSLLIIKNVKLDLNDEHTNLIDTFIKGKSMEMFGVDKGKLVILNQEQYDLMQSNFESNREQETKHIFENII